MDEFIKQSDEICKYLGTHFYDEQYAPIIPEILAFPNNIGFANNRIQVLQQLNVQQLLIPQTFNELRCYSVIPGYLYAGEIPSSINDHEFSSKIQCLKDLGITNIINLTEIDEQNFKGIPLRNYAEYAENQFHLAGLALNCVRYPIKDLDIPTITHMRTVLNAINQAIQDGGKVYVHCWGGLGKPAP